MIELTEEPIDPCRVLAEIGDDECGAQVLFVGTTRRWTNRGDDRLETDFLLYDSYREMALTQIEQLAADARQRWGVHQIAIVHRVGRVEPKEPSVAVAVSSPHRSEAFEAGRWLIDEIKHQVPIWKQEHYVQNGPEWIHPTNGSCNCHSDHSAMPETAKERDGSSPSLESCAESRHLPPQ